MRRGTTPTYTLTISGYDLTEMTVYVTVRGAFGKLITKTGDDLSISTDETGSVIAFRLTQAETLELNTGRAEVQVRFIDAQGVALATDIGEIAVERVLLPGEIEYRGD